MQSPRLRVHVISETEFVAKGQGVHTAFIDCVTLLRSGKDIDCIVNQEGWGDVMHAHTYGPYYFWKGLRYRGRKAITAHVIPDSIKGSLPAWKILMPLARRYFKRVYNFADVCIAISPVVEETLRRMKVKSRIVRINNPIRADEFFPTPQKRTAGRELLKVAPGAFVVLGVGQIENRKAVLDFLEIAAAFPELRFIWVGGRPFGPFTEGIARIDHRIAEARQSHPNIQFPGQFSLEQMPLIYCAADVLLFPSYQENSPLAPIEAAAAGLPVLFRDLPEYSRLYASPYLKSKDNAGFIELIKKLADDPDFRRRAVEMSRDLLKQFDKDEIRRQLIALYRDLAR